MNLTELFKKESVEYLHQSEIKIVKALKLINEEQLWYKPNENTNSIGNLLVHLEGNIRQYIISALGETKDKRIRDREFTVNHLPKEKVLNKFSNTLDEAIKIIVNIQTNKLGNTYSVQGFELTGINIIVHVTEHLSYHTGQIALLTKLLKNTQLGYYEGRDLNKTN